MFLVVSRLTRTIFPELVPYGTFINYTVHQCSTRLTVIEISIKFVTINSLASAPLHKNKPNTSTVHIWMDQLFHLTAQMSSFPVRYSSNTVSSVTPLPVRCHLCYSSPFQMYSLLLLSFSAVSSAAPLSVKCLLCCSSFCQMSPLLLLSLSVVSSAAPLPFSCLLCCSSTC
jgi:hypothetical protein